MEKVLLNSSVLIYLISEIILFIMLIIALPTSIKIVLKWNFYSHTKEQYSLEKSAFLITTVTFFVSIIKIFLLPYFIFTIDSLSNLITGAMCGAGVISANSYGLNLLLVKMLVVFVFILWILLNYQDIEAKNYPYFKTKMVLFILIVLLIFLETFLDILYFIEIEPDLPVSCCSTLFGNLEGSNPLPFGLNITALLSLFFLIFLVSIFSIIHKQKVISIISLTIFLYLSYYAVVYFFGLYIYQLPTHKCPFCMMQKEYFYVGYLIWGTLFSGVFIALSGLIIEFITLKELPKIRKLSLTLLIIFFLTSSFYVVKYFLLNGVLFDFSS